MNGSTEIAYINDQGQLVILKSPADGNALPVVAV